MRVLQVNVAAGRGGTGRAVARLCEGLRDLGVDSTVYAAQVDSMDQGIGRVLNTIERNGQLENTLILFLSDNGACAEEIFDTFFPYEKPSGEGRAKPLSCRAHTRDGRVMQHGNDPQVMPGDETNFQSYGVAWANLSNTPFREYKHFVHEGGIATP